MFVEVLIMIILISVVSVVDFSVFFMDENTEKLLYVDENSESGDDNTQETEMIINESIGTEGVPEDGVSDGVSEDVLTEEAEALINNMMDVGR